MAGSCGAQHCMTKVGCLLILLATLAAVAGCSDGSPPYNPQIRTWHDLDAVRYHLDKSYILMNDLDATTAGYTGLASPTANGGRGWLPIGAGTDPRRSSAFAASFDGQGYDIRDLFIDRPGEIQVGLFYGLSAGSIIQNVGLANVRVNGGSHAGPLVGRNHGTVSNCYSTGTVTGMGWSAGGLMGDNCGTLISSHSTVSVTGHRAVGGLVGDNWADGSVNSSYSTGSVTGHESVGGLVGCNRGGIVTNSYSTGSVTGKDAVGGLAGLNEGAVSTSYSRGTVTGKWWVGGLVAYHAGIVDSSYATGSVAGELAVGGLIGGSASGASTSNSFWDTDSSGQAISDGGTGKTTAEMLDFATFSGVGWDICAAVTGETDRAHAWNIVNGQSYPFLSWESVV
jgi:hypothetical protein